jgi:hypothetical protein
MDLYKDTIDEIKKLIEDNEKLFYDQQGDFRIKTKERNKIAFVYEKYGCTVCRVLLQELMEKKEEKSKDIYKELYSKMIEIVDILEKNKNIREGNRGVGGYIIKNLDIIIKIGGSCE